MFENQAIQDIWLKVLAKIIIIILADSVELAAEIWTAKLMYWLLATKIGMTGGWDSKACFSW